MVVKTLGEVVKEFTKEGYIKTTLPYGINRKGKICREIEVDEPDGYIEEQASDKKIIDDNPVRIFDTYITLCVKAVEGFKRDSELLNDKDPDAFTSSHVERLSMLDREFIFLIITFLFFGKDFKFEAKCPKCNGDIIYEEDISKIKIPYIEDGERIIEGKFKRPYVFRGKQVDKFYSLFPNGLLQSAWFDKEAKDNVAVFKTKALYSVLHKIDDFEKITLEEIQGMKKGMRDFIYETIMGAKALNTKDLSINLDRTAKCDCGEHSIDFTINNTFF